MYVAVAIAFAVLAVAFLLYWAARKAEPYVDRPPSYGFDPRSVREQLQ